MIIELFVQVSVSVSVSCLIFSYISGKFAKLYAPKLIAMQFRQPLAMQNFCHLRYADIIYLLCKVVCIVSGHAISYSYAYII